MKKKFLKILVMGLPGAGKTYMANILSKKINAYWINADQVRKENNDWDFSHEEEGVRLIECLIFVRRA